MKVGEFKGELPKAVVQAVLSGKACFFGEFRTGMAASFSGKAGRVFKKATCTVETQTGVVSVNEFLPDGVDVATWKPPFEKGTMVYGEIRGWVEESGAQVATAKLIAV